MIADHQKVELPGVEGILIYKDSFDDNIYYYTSTRPAIGKNDFDDFALALIEYDQPENDIVAALSFAVELEPSEDAFEKMTTELRKLNPNASLPPKRMPWTSGTVTAAIMEGQPVKDITPSLIGGNAAAVSIPLSTREYQLLKESVRDGISRAISVVYKLSFDAYGPSSRLNFKVNEDRFRNWVQTKCSANLLFVSFESVDTFEELKKAGAVEISSEVYTDDPQGELRLAFLQSLKTLLTPLPQFAAPPEGGKTWLIGFDCSTVRDIQNIQRQIEGNLQVNAAVTRSVFIQGALENLSDAYKAGPKVKMPRADQLFTHDQVFRSFDAFDGHPLKYMIVYINGKYPYSHPFNKDDSGEWPITLTYDPGQAPYTYHCQLYFSEALAKTPAITNPLTTDLITVPRDKSFVFILPAEFYTYRRYAVYTVSDFPWTVVELVRITFRALPPGTVSAPETLDLFDAKASEMEVFSTASANLEAVEYTVLCALRNGGRSFELRGLANGNTILVINPFQKKTLKVRVDDANWSRFKAIKLTFQLPSGATPEEKSSIVFQRGDLTPVSWSYWYADLSKVQYKLDWSPAGGGERPKPTEWLEVKKSTLVISAPN